MRKITGVQATRRYRYRINLTAATAAAVLRVYVVLLIVGHPIACTLMQDTGQLLLLRLQLSV